MGAAERMTGDYMAALARMLQAFWAGFGLDAYPEENVPSDVQFPYITYSIVMPDFYANALHQARVWYRTTSYGAILAKVDEIKRAIGPEGVRLQSDDGLLVLRPSGTEAQFQPIEKNDESPELKVVYMTFQLNFFGKEE